MVEYEIMIFVEFQARSMRNHLLSNKHKESLKGAQLHPNTLQKKNSIMLFQKMGRRSESYQRNLKMRLMDQMKKTKKLSDWDQPLLTFRIATLSNF